MEEIGDHNWGKPYKAYNSLWYMACENEGCNAIWQIEVRVEVERTIGDPFIQGEEV